MKLIPKAICTPEFHAKAVNSVQTTGLSVANAAKLRIPLKMTGVSD